MPLGAAMVPSGPPSRTGPVTAALFGDNYFEFYANGELVGRDAVAFTPFNSHVARFQVKYPVT